MDVAVTFIEKGYPKQTVLRLSELARSSFYYNPKPSKQERKPCVKYLDGEHSEIGDQQVVQAILNLFENKFVDYGYYKVFIYLRDVLGYKVNKYSVYKTMKTRKLLQPNYAFSSKRDKRNWAVDLIPNAAMPFDYLEFDRGDGPHKVRMGYSLAEKHDDINSFRCI